MAIQIKERKCKGTGKAKGFGCGTMQLKRTYGLGHKCKCFKNWLLNSEAGKEVIAKTVLRSSKKVEKDKKKEEVKARKKQKESMKSIQKLIQEARKPFQKWIRLRDINDACISCGSIDSDIWDAGHYFKAEIYSGLIFDERNVHKQCRKCNTYLNGNEGEYRKRLIEKFGQEWMDQLDEDANRLRSYKYSKEELIEIKNKYLTKLKNHD